MTKDSIYNLKYKEEYDFWMKEYKKLINAKQEKEKEIKKEDQTK